MPSADPVSRAPMCRATSAVTPVATAAKKVVTSITAWFDRPTAATALAPRWPTMKVSASPTSMFSICSPTAGSARFSTLCVRSSVRRVFRACARARVEGME